MIGQLSEPWLVALHWVGIATIVLWVLCAIVFAAVVKRPGDVAEKTSHVCLGYLMASPLIAIDLLVLSHATFSPGSLGVVVSIVFAALSLAAILIEEADSLFLPTSLISSLSLIAGVLLILTI